MIAELFKNSYQMIAELFENFDQNTGEETVMVNTSDKHIIHYLVAE